MFINEATGNNYNDAIVTVNVTGLNLATTGEYYEYGWDNDDAGFGPYEQMLTGLNGTFQIRIPDVSIVTLLIAPAQPAGDYNGDGVINAADYTVWRDTLGSTTDLRADGNHNNMIDANDYDVWRIEFWTVVRSWLGRRHVPEPMTPCMLVSGGILMVVSRRFPVSELSRERLLAFESLIIESDSSRLNVRFT